MMTCLMVALGGALGAVCRYGMSVWVQRSAGMRMFPLGTLAVNLTGAFLIGILWVWADRHMISSQMRMLVFIGFLGAFTTFSTFCFENMQLLRDGEWGYALYNITLSNVLGLACVFAGFLFASRFMIRS